MIKINACALGHKLPIYQLFKGVVCYFFFFEDLQSLFLQMTRWKKWKALNEINENRCPRPMTSELLSRFENYQVIWIRTARECKNFKCRNVFGRHLLEILSRMYIHVYKYCKSGIVEINVYYIYISEWIDLVKSLCVCRLILKLHIAKK